MIFQWNIDQWGENETPVEIRKEPNLSYLKVLLKPIKTLYNEFMTFRIATIQRMRGNCQTIVLENILNDLFDPTQRDIRITTAYSTNSPNYVYTKAELLPLFVYTTAENKPVYVRTQNEYGRIYDFIVEARAGSLTAAQIVRLKAVVNYYRFYGTRPTYRYLITLTPF